MAGGPASPEIRVLWVRCARLPPCLRDPTRLLASVGVRGRGRFGCHVVVRHTTAAPTSVEDALAAQLATCETNLKTELSEQVAYSRSVEATKGVGTGYQAAIDVSGQSAPPDVQTDAPSATTAPIKVECVVGARLSAQGKQRLESRPTAAAVSGEYRSLRSNARVWFTTEGNAVGDSLDRPIGVVVQVLAGRLGHPGGRRWPARRVLPLGGRARTRLQGTGRFARRPASRTRQGRSTATQRRRQGPADRPAGIARHRITPTSSFATLR